MLHYEFMQRLHQLPSEYSYGEYRELYRDYGTHYIKEATVGGIYEYTLVLNSSELQKGGTCMVVKKLWGRCFGGKTPLRAPSGGSGLRLEKRDGGRSQQYLRESLREMWEQKCFMAVNKEPCFQSTLSIMASPSSQASSQKGPVASILDDTFWRLTRCWDEWESCSLPLLLALKTFTLSSFSIAFQMTVLKHL